jgi:hypothetical protein
VNRMIRVIYIYIYIYISLYNIYTISTQFLKLLHIVKHICCKKNKNKRFVTLFQEADSPSRFVRQRILVNTDPIMKRFQELRKVDPKCDGIYNGGEFYITDII